MALISLDNITLTEEGYLVDWQIWDEQIANAIAEQELINLETAHWIVIFFLRDFYAKYKNMPPIRALIKILEKELPAENISSATLYRLFPKGPLKQASKIAGLPKPARCL